MDDPLSDLVARSQHGDKLAFSELVAETQVGVYNLALQVLRNQQEAEDMTQEVFLRTWSALPSFRGESKFSTWLYRIATNVSLNRRRQLRAQLAHIDDDETLMGRVGSGRDPVAATIDDEFRSAVWTAVARLPTKYRLVISLFYGQQLSYQEMSETLSLPLGTVKAHLNRARKALAKQLEQHKVGEVEDVAL